MLGLHAAPLGSLAVVAGQAAPTFPQLEGNDRFSQISQYLQQLEHRAYLHSYRLLLEP